MIPRKPITTQAALVKAEELCARAEHSSGEILEKLRRWGVPSERAGQIIDSLIDRRFIDDARFARAFVRDKLEYAGWGRRKIALHLCQKRVARSIINEALDEIDEDAYLRRLATLLARKAAQIGDEATTYEGRTRLFRWAASRGFEPDAISKAMRSE